MRKKSSRLTRGNLENIIEEVLYAKLAHFLKDIDWRIKHVTALADKVSAEQLNLQHHLITGYTVTNNSPVAGSIAWAGLHIVHQGTDYTITNANTALKYVYWDKSLSTTVLQTSGSKPTLISEDVLVFINEGGTAHVLPGSTQPHGASIFASTIDTGELKALAVTSGILAANAVIAGKIATGGVSASTQFATGVVDSSALGTAAVIAGKIGTGGISASGQFATGVVDSLAIGSNAVTAIKIAAGSVTEPKLNTLVHLIY